MDTQSLKILGVAKRRPDFNQITRISTIGRTSLETVPNYRLYKAATRAEASPPARLLLVHLIGYLPVDQTADPAVRFVVWPGNTRLADELHYSKRTIQRLADELEEKGLLRRCYNGLNRRTGFDLTPLAMQHETIEASIIAIHTRRKVERDQLQLELSLAADQIRRPSLETSSSSQDDNSDIHNSPSYQDSAESSVEMILDSVEQMLITNLCGSTDVGEDRTGQNIALKEAHILKNLTGSGRAAHLGWTLAKRTYGFDRAAALCAIAEHDPKRKASTERYFGWLLRMAMTGDGHAIIEQASKRAAEKAVSLKNNPPRIIPTGEIEAETGEPASAAVLRQAIGAELGRGIYEAWLTKVRIFQSKDQVTIRANSPFYARYIEDNYGSQILFAIQAALGSQEVKVEYRVA